MSNPEHIKSQCNKCYGETVHDLLYEKKDSGSEYFDDGFSIVWGVTWSVIQCRGCNSVTMKRDAWNSEAADDEGIPEIETTYFPPRIFREFPEWLQNDFFTETCPAEVKMLMKELYVALQNDCRAASTMLMRAVLEHTMIKEIGDNGSFSKNVTKFEEAGFIGKKQAEGVSSMLEAGHASIHRAFVPRKEDLVTLVEILEGVLKAIYCDGPKVSELRKRIPERNRKELRRVGRETAPPASHTT